MVFSKFWLALLSERRTVAGRLGVYFITGQSGIYALSHSFTRIVSRGSYRTRHPIPHFSLAHNHRATMLAGLTLAIYSRPFSYAY